MTAGIRKTRISPWNKRRASEIHTKEKPHKIITTGNVDGSPKQEH